MTWDSLQREINKLEDDLETAYNAVDDWLWLLILGVVTVGGFLFIVYVLAQVGSRI